MLIVQVCHFDDNGDAHYRLHEPSRHLALLPGVTTIDCHFAHRFLPDLAERADVLVLQFVNDWELMSLCARRRALGKITVFEANDYFFDLQPWSPIAARWQDRTVQELYLQLLAFADGVQTSTDELARHWRRRGARNVAVFANHLTELTPLPDMPRRPLTIGWAGSPGHFADWYHVVPNLSRWLAAHPDVHLAVMTNELAHSFFQLPPERYHFTPFGSLADYLRFLRSVDIGLAPLLPTDYNRCRSDVKFLEYASQGAVGIYADLEPYRGSVAPNETGFLYRTPGEMIRFLDQLVAQPDLRRRIRSQAYDHVSRRRVLRDHIGARLQWYRGLMSAPPATTSLPAEILAAAQAEGQYLRLVPQEPETVLLDVLSQPPSRDASTRIARVLEQQPRYLAAWQTQGRLLNDQGDHRGALAHLERAKALAPHSVQTYCETGRAWFRLNELDRARGVLEDAIRLNQLYLPAWQYLLRMLALTKHPDGPRWVEEALERFPACYPVALLGTSTYPPRLAAALLLRLLDRFAPTFTAEEKPIALAAFRDAILSLIQNVPAPELVPLLRRACAVFPESTALAGALGSALLAIGETDEGYRQHVRALDQMRQANLVRQEFPKDDTPPYIYVFAEHIAKHPIAASPAAARPVGQPQPAPAAPQSIRPAATVAAVDPARDEAYRRYQAGDVRGAETLCRQILERQPGHAEAMYLLGAIALDAGHIDQASELFRQTVRLAPDNAVFANALGEVQLQQGKRADAEASFRQAARLRPEYDRVHNNLGRLLHMQDNLPAAAEHFSEAVRLNPQYAIAHNNLGAVRQRQGQLDAAAECFQKALTIRPDYPEAHFNLGTIRQAMGDPVRASQRFQEAIRLRPTYARAHFHLGQVLELLRRGPEALASYETAARLQPDDAEIQRRLGDLLMQKPDWPGALAALERAVALQPGEAEPFARLAYAKQLVCDWRTYDADNDRLWADAQRLIAAGEATTVVPFQALTLPWPRDRLLAVARSHCDAVVRHHRKWHRDSSFPGSAWERTSPQALPADASVARAQYLGGGASRDVRSQAEPGNESGATSRKRLRIGYLSGDYYDHPISHLLYGMFGHHDRERFEVFAYSFGPPDNSVYRTRIAAECEHFVEVAHLSVGELAQRITADGIDILVDLMGHTGINRLGALALRPAPIQVSFLGMLGTMGADFIDYLIGDRTVTPPEFAPDFTEKFATMPHAYLIAEPETNLPSAAVRRGDHGLPETGFVFCSFNSTYKLEPRMFAAWMRILAQTPGSVLWLYTTGEVLEGNLRREATARGVAPERLVFAPFLPRPEHIARHRAADLFLDTLLYNAAATASLALQTGLPFLTCLGDTFASRVGASLLHAVGLPELIATDLAHYERLAVELALDPEALNQLRAKLGRIRSSASLYDTPRFVRNLERAYREMANRRAAGEPPQPFEVSESRPP
jgi:predicted O-linked N-acetylglucosamine transferase (SPINDLY family)